MQKKPVLTRTFYNLCLICSVIGVFALSMVLMLPMNIASAQPPAPTPQPDRVPIATLYELPLTADVEYVVQPRDTLDQIAAAFDIRLECLYETNDLRTWDIIPIGLALVISMECPAYDGVGEVVAPRLDSPGRTGDDGTYVVRPGDTFDTIGQRFNISVEDLFQANDWERGQILRAGTVLVLPPDAVPYGVVPAIRDNDLNATTQALIDSGELQGAEYVIQPGDTLDHVSAQYNVDTQCVIERNQLQEVRIIYPGQIVVIPSDCPAYRGYDFVPANPPNNANPPASDTPPSGGGG